jgi:hypothetical protein
MAKLLATRAAQMPLVQEFTFDVSTAAADTMATVVGNVIGGASPTFQSPTQAMGGFYAGVGQIYEIMPLPVGATVLSGELVVGTAVVGPTASGITIGDSGNATRYLGSTSLLSAARTAMVPTGFIGNGENIRVTITNTVAVATAGRVTLRLTYTIAGRQSEVAGV